MFQNKNLAVIAYANGATVWHYRDTKIKYSNINLNKFFNSIYRLCAVGDKIIINVNDVYAEAVIIRLKNGDVICRELSSIKYDLAKQEEK